MQIANLSFLLIVLGVVQKYGINLKIFCFFAQGFQSLMNELNFMPLIAMWCSICPKNLEATSITLFTGLINLSSNISNYFGSLILLLLEVSKDNLDDLWLPLLIQNIYLLILAFSIIFIEFPNEPQ